MLHCGCTTPSDGLCPRLRSTMPAPVRHASTAIRLPSRPEPMAPMRPLPIETDIAGCRLLQVMRGAAAVARVAAGPGCRPTMASITSIPAKLVPHHPCAPDWDLAASVPAVAHRTADVRACEADIRQHVFVHRHQLLHVAPDAQLGGNRGADPRQDPGGDSAKALAGDRGAERLGSGTSELVVLMSNLLPPRGAWIFGRATSSSGQAKIAFHSIAMFAFCR